MNNLAWAILGCILGVFLRDLRDRLLSLEKQVRGFVERQKQEELPKAMGFAEPMTQQEVMQMEEEERLERINGM